MSIKIDMLRAFCAVVQSGNLAEAANRLGRTPSALSMSLRQLEEHLGKKLFEGERKNALSVLGEQVYEIALKEVRQFDYTVSSLEATAQATHGLLRIVSVPSVAALMFPAVLQYMTERYPGLQIEMRDTDTQQVLDALLIGTADIGIASRYQVINGVRAIPLFEDHFGLLCAADHPLINQAQPLRIADVVGPYFMRNSLCDMIGTHAFEEATKHINVTIHNTHSLIAMVQTGKWVTILPQTVAWFIPESAAFRRINDLPDTRKVYLYVRERARFDDLTQECVRFITDFEIENSHFRSEAKTKK